MGALLGMTHAGYVIGGWVAAFGAIGSYAVVTVIRGRRLSRKVPPRERRWS